MSFKRRRIPDTKLVEKARDKYERENLLSARIILADPARYPGLMREWALVIDPASKPVEHPEDDRLPLLRGLVA